MNIPRRFIIEDDDPDLLWKFTAYIETVVTHAGIDYVVAKLQRGIFMSKNNTCSSTACDTYTAEQIALILGISVRKAYMLCEETDDFKVIRLGRSLRIHKESFDSWFNDKSGSSQK